MDIRGQSKKTRNAWVTLSWLWQVVFWGHVVLLSAVALADSETTIQRLQLIGLMAVYAVVSSVGERYFVAPTSHEQRQKGFDLPVYLGIIFLCAVWYGLIQTHYVYFFLLNVLYTQTNRYIVWRWALPINLFLTANVIAAASAISLVELINWSDPMWYGTLVSVIGVSCASAWLAAVVSQSEERRNLLEELERTRSELVKVERNAGVLEERTRLSREIHDTLAQGFTSILLHLQAAEQSIAPDNVVATRHIDHAHATAKTSLEQARRVVADLRPQPLERGKTVDQALARVLNSWQQSAQIDTQMKVTGEPFHLHPDVETTLLRALQEGLSNVRKYAQATETNVTLSYMEDMVILDVQDNGVGMALEAADSSLSGGFGLMAMRERVEELQGNMLIESAPNDGTTLAIAIPI